MLHLWSSHFAQSKVLTDNSQKIKQLDAPVLVPSGDQADSHCCLSLPPEPYILHNLSVSLSLLCIAFSHGLTFLPRCGLIEICNDHHRRLGGIIAAVMHCVYRFEKAVHQCGSQFLCQSSLDRLGSPLGVAHQLLS